MGVGFWKPGGPLLLMLPNLTALLLLAGTFLILNWPPVSVKTTAIRINRGGLQYERLEKSRNCSRVCIDGARPKECYFKFILEPVVTAGRDCSSCSGNETQCKNQPCITADGFKRTVITVNGQLPGTPIQVCEGDVIVVDVENRLPGLETSLHWHGQLQRGTPYMDGAPMITQCPIESNTRFRYKFRASNPGTHFYRSHYVSHQADGILGPFIVRQTYSHDPQSKLYDHDLDNHVITITPWSHSLLAYNVDFQENSKISSLLINGKGSFHNAEGQKKTEISMTEFAVMRGKRYRFRIINAAYLDCPVHFQVEGHDLTIIAADGAPVKPTLTSHIILYPGERYDVVLHAKEKVSSYWIHVRGHHKCKGIHQEGLLVYNGANADSSAPESSLNMLTASMAEECSDDTLENCNVPALKSLGKEQYPELKNVQAESTIFIPYDTFTYDNVDDKIINFNFTFDDLPYYPSYLYNRKRPVQLPQVKGMAFLYPPSPLLSQIEEVPESMLCGEKCPLLGVFCECLNILHVPLNITLDIVLIDQGWGSNQSHTFHLHGYSSHVLGSRSLGHPVNLSEVEDLDRQGKLSRNLKDPPRRDTVVIPNKGYAILRLSTNNPGYWLFEARSTSPIINEGMQFVLHVGEKNHLPSIPPNFPRCGTLKGPNFIF